MRLILVLLLLACGDFGQGLPPPTTGLATDPTASAQSPAPPAPAIPANLPAYFLGLGTAYGFFGGRGWSSSAEIAIRAGNSAVYSYTDLEEARNRSAQVATGGAFAAKVTGSLTLVAVGAAGLSSASFSAGADMLWDIGSVLSKGKDHAYLSAWGRPLTVAGNASVKPAYGLTFGFGF